MTLQPGLHHHVPFADYLAIPAMSQSTLKAGRISMAHLKAAMDAPKVPTDAMLLGSALHAGFLEPERLVDEVVRWDGPRRAGQEWRDFQEEHSGKIILTRGYHEQLVGMMRSLRAHPEVRKWTARPGDVEVTAIGDIDGVRCKARADKLTDDPIIDLKSCRDADPRLFGRDVARLGYHVQAGLYTQIFDRRRFILMAVESVPPFDVVAYELDDAAITQGRREVTELLHDYRECLDSGTWPGRSDEIIKLDLPAWAVEEPALTMHGIAI